MVSTEEFSFLFHYTPPLGLGGEPLLFILRPEGEPEQLSLRDLSTVSEPIVTHSFTLLVDWCRSAGLALPRKVVDIEIAKKLVTGMRRQSAGGRDAPWTLWKMLSSGTDDGESPAASRYLNHHMRLPSGEEFDQTTWGSAMARRIAEVWHELTATLRGLGEEERFLSVEVPAYNLMLQVQRTGIGIDAAACEDFLDDVDADYEATHYDLAIKQGINIQRALHDHEYLADVAGLSLEGSGARRSAFSLIEEHRGVSTQCDQLRQLRLLKINRDILFRTSISEAGQCFVVFDTMGTVSARILASDPHLQHLKKKYRAILIPRHNAEFLYIDYAHFEPSIMAALSGDSTLVDLCADGDFYEGLAAKLADSAFGRKEIKELYLAYSYGMEPSELPKLAATFGAGLAPRAARIGTAFSEMMAGVEEWKERVYKELAETGRIGTVLGNYRYRTREGDLEASERRWAVSQVVQGTGSLVLKRLCIAIGQEISGVRILLPMHDALLLEVPSSDASDLAQVLVDRFKRTFAEVCPGVEARVTIGGFSPAIST